jgi:hypothetical protein
MGGQMGRDAPVRLLLRVGFAVFPLFFFWRAAGQLEGPLMRPISSLVYARLVIFPVYYC